MQIFSTANNWPSTLQKDLERTDVNRAGRVGSIGAISEYPRSVLDVEAVHYCEVQHFLGEIVWGLEGVAAGRRFDGRMDQRWLLREIREEAMARVELRIGHALSPV